MPFIKYFEFTKPSYVLLKAHDGNITKVFSLKEGPQPAAFEHFVNDALKTYNYEVQKILEDGSLTLIKDVVYKEVSKEYAMGKYFFSEVKEGKTAETILEHFDNINKPILINAMDAIV